MASIFRSWRIQRDARARRMGWLQANEEFKRGPVVKSGPSAGVLVIATALLAFGCGWVGRGVVPPDEPVAPARIADAAERTPTPEHQAAKRKKIVRSKSGTNGLAEALLSANCQIGPHPDSCGTPEADKPTESAAYPPAP